MGRDVYYKTEGPAIGLPAPVTEDNEEPTILGITLRAGSSFGLPISNISTMASFVLAVPIFCMCIEFAGMVSKDKAMAKKYDQLAYDFIKISLTAYSLTAILRWDSHLYILDSLPCILWISIGYFPSGHAHLRPDVRGGKWRRLYIYYYGWDKMREGVLKWVHLEYVSRLECHRNRPHVLGQFLDCVHDVSCRG